MLAFLERDGGPHRRAERRTAEQEERPARAVRHFERHARNPQGGRRGAAARVARAQDVLLSRAEIHRRVRRRDGRAGRGDLHRRHRPGQRGSARAGVAGAGLHGHPSRRAAQPRRARLRRGVPHLDRRLEGGGARRADRRGTHDGARGVARAEPVLHHARARSAEAAAVSRRGLGPSHPSHAGTRRGVVRPGTSAHRDTPTFRSPASMPARSSSPSSGRRAASNASACSARRASSRRSRSR